MARSKQANHKRREKARATMPEVPTGIPPEQYLQNAGEVLTAVRHAVEDFVSAPTVDRAKTAMRNFLEQGRSVTWALSHLERYAADKADWEKWWAQARATIHDETASRWFYDLRNPVVKEGQPVRVHSRGLTLNGVFNGPPGPMPPGATSWILDGQGDPFWVMADGSQVPSAPPPGLNIHRQWTLAELPQTMQDKPLNAHMRRHLAVLSEIVALARTRFGSVAE